jgi:hypothetical protein
MDRVEINGVWYVREDLTPVEKSINGFKFIDNQEYMERNVAHVETISYEDDDYLLELEGLVTQKLGKLSMISLKIEDKNNVEQEYWDNENFLKGLVELNLGSIEGALDDESKIEVTHELLNLIINLLKVGQDKGML